MRKLAPKTKWLFFLKSILKIFFVFTFFVFYPLFSLLEEIFKGGVAVFGTIIATFLITAIISYIAAFLIYKNYEYDLTKEGFRKKYGVISKNDISIPYDRIQNVDIERSILARILGLAEVNIHTAGEMSFRGRSGLISKKSEGFIPGVLPQEAERIRKKLINRSRNESSNRSDL